MCSSPSKNSFTLKELLEKINTLIPQIDSFLEDIGSGRAEWLEVRRHLNILGKLVTRFDPDFKISDASLLEQFNKLKLDKLREFDFTGFRDNLCSFIPASPKGSHSTFNEPSQTNSSAGSDKKENGDKKPTSPRKSKL